MSDWQGSTDISACTAQWAEELDDQMPGEELQITLCPRRETCRRFYFQTFMRSQSIDRPYSVIEPPREYRVAPIGSDCALRINWTDKLPLLN